MQKKFQGEKLHCFHNHDKFYHETMNISIAYFQGHAVYTVKVFTHDVLGL